jgi:hypothetical protein
MNFLEGLFLLPRLSSCHNSVGAWKLRWRAGPLLLVIFSCRNCQVYAEMLSYASCCFLSFFLYFLCITWIISAFLDGITGELMVEFVRRRLMGKIKAYGALQDEHIAHFLT